MSAIEMWQESAARFRSDVPHVQIVNVVDSFDPPHGSLNLLEFDPSRRALEQNVERLAHDAESRPQDQDADRHR